MGFMRLRYDADCKEIKRLEIKKAIGEKTIEELLRRRTVNASFKSLLHSANVIFHVNPKQSFLQFALKRKGPLQRRPELETCMKCNCHYSPLYFVIIHHFSPSRILKRGQRKQIFKFSIVDPYFLKRPRSYNFSASIGALV